jgi:hypothetical protein
LYKHYIWNIGNGVITQIKNLKYDDQRGFYLELPETKTENEIVNLKRISNKTLFTKENEKIINEEILSFILKNKGDVKDDTKDALINTIKEKLKIKKIFNDDKKKIFKTYDDILKVVLENIKN